MNLHAGATTAIAWGGTPPVRQDPPPTLNRRWDNFLGRRVPRLISVEQHTICGDTSDAGTARDEQSPVFWRVASSSRRPIYFMDTVKIQTPSLVLGPSGVYPAVSNPFATTRKTGLRSYPACKQKAQTTHPYEDS